MSRPSARLITDRMLPGVLEPRDRRAFVAHDPARVLVEALVALELHALLDELVNRGVDVVDLEVETVNVAVVVLLGVRMNARWPPARSRFSEPGPPRP